MECLTLNKEKIPFEVPGINSEFLKKNSGFEKYT